MAMDSSRRTFLGLIVPAVALGSTLAAWGSQQPPKPLPGSQAQNPPPPPPPPPLFPRIGQQDDTSPKLDPHAVLKAYQKDIKRDIQKLWQLAQELKKEVEETNSAEVLNLNLVRKAEEIEKLAHQIKTMARG
jgi:hypothetical protein